MPFSAQAMLGSFHTTAAANTAPALPTLTSSGQTQFFRLYSDAPGSHLYQDTGLTTPASSGNTVMGIKDISGASHNFTDTQSSRGAVLTAAALNGKRALLLDGSNSLLESDNGTNINLLRTATNVAIMMVVKAVSFGTQPYLLMASVKSRSSPFDCLTVRLGGGGGSNIQLGRWGGNSGANAPLNVYSTAMHSAWSDYTNLTLKFVLRAATGTGAIQQLDIGATDGTFVAAPGNVQYTNNGTDDVDSTSNAWDYLVLGGWYNTSGGYSGPACDVAEAVIWTGTSQMNDADVAALLTYGAGTAGF